MVIKLQNKFTVAAVLMCEDGLFDLFGSFECLGFFSSFSLLGPALAPFLNLGINNTIDAINNKLLIYLNMLCSKFSKKLQMYEVLITNRKTKK